MNTSTGSIKHRQYIDAVRGVAFLWVMTLHCVLTVGLFPFRWLFERGALGVSLFFMASALTLRASWAQRKAGEAHPAWFFYIRRFARIAPMYWLSLLAYSLVPQIMPHFWLTVNAPLGMQASYYVLNASFLHGWFPYAFNSVVPGGWSIGVEMTFYAICPLFFLWLGTARRVAVATLVVFCLSYGLSGPLGMALHPLFHTIVGNDSAYIFWVQRWFPSQLPTFLLGFCIYHAVNHPAVAEQMKKPFWAATLACLSALALFSLLTGHSYFIQISVWILMAMAAGVVALSGDVLPAFMPRILRYIGTVSYSAYLVHFAVLGLTLKAFGIVLTISDSSHDFGSAAANFGHFVLFSTVTLIGTVLVATFTYRFVEKPGIELGRRLIHRLNRPMEAGRP